MRERIKTEVAIATSAIKSKQSTRRRKNKSIVNLKENPAIDENLGASVVKSKEKKGRSKNKTVENIEAKAAIAFKENLTSKRPPSNKSTYVSKKALPKKAYRINKYRPFTVFKESTGEEGNYRKLIYNTPKY